MSDRFEDLFRWIDGLPETDFRPEPVTQPKVTAVELVVRFADGKVARYDFAGHPGHHIQVELEQRQERDSKPLWYQDRPIYTQSPKIVATVTAKGGNSPDPLLVLRTEEPT